MNPRLLIAQLLFTLYGPFSFGTHLYSSKQYLFGSNSGYSAIIIHNVGSDSAMQMGGDDSFEINISAVSMGEFQAADLMNYGYNKDPRYTIKITSKATRLAFQSRC